MWFQAMWYVTSQKFGGNALGLKRVLGLGSYQTAWSWLHKMRRAMVRPDRKRLSGNETFEFSLNWLKFMISSKFLKIRRNFFYKSCFDMIKISFFEAFQALKLFVMRCFNPVLIPGHTSPLVYVTGMIFDPLNKLHASCRHMASQIFFVMVVNRALNAPPCR